jgi:hypothetical protein
MQIESFAGWIALLLLWPPVAVSCRKPRHLRDTLEILSAREDLLGNMTWPSHDDHHVMTTCIIIVA